MEKQAAWTVQEAKARLSEVLRRARHDGPQQVGTSHPCLVVSMEAWEARAAAKPSLGRWLAENTPRGEPDLALPERREPQRPSPFADEEA